MRFRSAVRLHVPGMSMVAALFIVAALSLAAVAVVLLTGKERESATLQSKGLTAEQCAEAGIQYGKWLFGRQDIFLQWNQILLADAQRIQGKPPASGPTTWNAAIDLGTISSATSPAAWQGPICSQLRCDLFGMNVDTNGDGTPDNPGDLDGDGLPDFRVSIYDNQDEYGATLAACQADPAVMVTNCLGRDNDLTVILRSECIKGSLAASSTPRVFATSTKLEEDTDSRPTKVVEATLRFVPNLNGYTSQRAGGASSSGTVLQ